MNTLKVSAASAILACALGATAFVAPASADAVFVTGTFNCPANSNTPCKLTMTPAGDTYTNTISCQWSNPRVSLVQASVVSGGSTLYAVAFALTSDERSARGMTRTDPPSIPIMTGQSLTMTFQASNSAANSVTCYILGY